MNHKDSLIQREEERRRGQMTEQKSVMGSSSKPRGFRKHPDDPNNPNQVQRAVEELQAGKRRPCCWPGCPHRRPSAKKWFEKRTR
jgi:hypothetical protein